MRKSKLRLQIGLLMVLGQFVTIGTLLGVGLLRYPRPFAVEDLWTSVALLVPLFATHAAVVISYIVANAETPVNPKHDAIVNGQFAFFAFFFPVLLILYLLLVVLGKAYGSVQDFAQFRTLVAIGEGLLGINTGIFIKALYG